MAETVPFQSIEYPGTRGSPTMPDGEYQSETWRYVVDALKTHFRRHTDVYVSGDLFVYLEEGKPRSCIAPDLFVVLGAGNHRRDTYKVWQEPGGMPDFVLEIVSPSTWRADLGARRATYAKLGVTEYWLYDPHGRHLRPALCGYRLVEGRYLPFPAVELSDGLAMHSDVLGLDVHLEGERLRIFDPVAGRFLRSHEEAEARIAQLERAPDRSAGK